MQRKFIRITVTTHLLHLRCFDTGCTLGCFFRNEKPYGRIAPSNENWRSQKLREAVFTQLRLRQKL